MHNKRWNTVQTTKSKTIDYYKFIFISVRRNDKNNKNKINTSTTNTNIIFLLQHNNSKNYMESNKELPKYRLYENYYGIHRK